MIEEDRNTLPQIVVSNRNPHLLETTDGLPFLMLGDTAWELLHRITYDEAREYLEVRANQGFNMIWANVLAEFDGLHMPNRNGDLPLHNDDPSKPNEAYFAHVDRVVAAAEEFGLYVGLLPAWGDKLTAPWGEGPAIFRLNNLEVAQSYGEFLGQRYGGKTNILWVLGGDRPARLFGDEDQYPKQAAKDAGLPLDSDWTPIWAAMAYGIRKSGATHPITYHPQGGMGSTSVLLHDEPWLDMNAMQSGHGGGHDVPVWEAIARDFAMLPVKPTFDAEPNYEDHPVSPWPTWDPSTTTTSESRSTDRYSQALAA